MKCNHKWKFKGGRAACHNNFCACVVGVYECIICGDYDYGDDEANETKEQCDMEYATSCLSEKF